MWQIRRFRGNDRESALRGLVEFINQMRLTHNQFQILACPDHVDSQAILLFRDPSEAAYADYPSLCQTDTWGDE